MAGISDKALKSNYAENKYRYNDKELQNKEFSNGTGFEEYDYGARFQDPQLGRFFTQDRFANKYYELTPYQYGGNNPMIITDQNGDSLIVGGSPSATQTFQQIANTGLGNAITLGQTSTGNYVFNSPAGVDAATALTFAKGNMSPEQAAFADVLNNAMNATDPAGNPVDVKFNAVDGNDAISSKVIIGDNGVSSGTATPGVHTIDVGDMQALGSTGALTAQGALGHEIAEGTSLQSRFTSAQYAAAPANGRDIESGIAHLNFGIPAENRINGNVRGIGGADRGPAGLHTVVSISVSIGGVTRTVTMIFINGNLSPEHIHNN